MTQPIEPPTGVAGDIRRAIAILDVHPSTIVRATASLLTAIADDMDEAAAYERKAFAETPAEHLQVWDWAGVRLDWTEALSLARTILMYDPSSSRRATS